MVKRKDGRWQETVQLPGMDKPKYFYGATKAEIKKKILAWELQQELKTGFASVAEEWWDVHSPKLAHNTAKSYAPALKRAQEHFGDTPINTLKPVDISRFIKQFARKGYAQKTAKTQLLVVNLISSYAVERGLTDYNAARDVKVPEGLSKKKVTAPSSEDIARVKSSTACTFGMFAYWLLYTGMRRGELLALDWSDVDVKKRIIHVRRSLYHVGNAPEIKEPKTKTSIGSVPLLDALYNVIKPKTSGLVFPDPQTGTYITNKRFQTLWKKYLQESEISATPHQFRHAFATMLFEAGIPAEKAQIILRHAQVSTTMDIYRDIRAEKMAELYKDVYTVDIT